MNIDFIKSLSKDTGCPLKQCKQAYLYFGVNYQACYEWLTQVSCAVFIGNNKRIPLTKEEMAYWIKKKYGIF